MQLNHLDLSVPDVAATTAFFVDGFGFTLLEQRGTHGMAILRGDGGVTLVLTRCAEPVYPKTFHIGFLLPSPEAVTQACQSLLAAGIAVPKPPTEMRGAFLFYCTAPGGILVEVGHRPMDQGGQVLKPASTASSSQVRR
jgi:lactoylglutathione lyase